MANLKNLIVNGVSRFVGKLYASTTEIGTINGVTVGTNPKFTDTTYTAATTSANGLMSSTDKTNLNNLQTNLGGKTVVTTLNTSANIPTSNAVITYIDSLNAEEASY